MDGIPFGGHARGPSWLSTSTTSRRCAPSSSTGRRGATTGRADRAGAARGRGAVARHRIELSRGRRPGGREPAPRADARGAAAHPSQRQDAARRRVADRAPEEPERVAEPARGHGHNVGMLTGDGLVALDVDLYHPDGKARSSGCASSDCRSRPSPRSPVAVAGTTCTARRTRSGRRRWRGSPASTSRPTAVRSSSPRRSIPTPAAPTSGSTPGARRRRAARAAGGDRCPVRHRRRDERRRQLDERDEAAVNLLLEHFGGHHPRVRAGWVEVCRPGKDDGASATVGRLGAGVVKVWSSNWPGLPAGVYGGHELRKLAGVDEPKVHAPGIEPPEGFRWWRGGDDAATPLAGPGRLPRRRRRVHDARHRAHGGPPGRRRVHDLRLPRCLARAGHWYAAGRAIRHHPALWGALVGETASGGKGMAGDVAELFLDAIDPILVKAALDQRVRLAAGADRPAAPGDEGKRRAGVVVHEHELAERAQAVRARGLDAVGTLRKAYDRKPLGNLTREHGDAPPRATSSAPSGRSRRPSCATCSTRCRSRTASPTAGCCCTARSPTPCRAATPSTTSSSGTSPTRSSTRSAARSGRPTGSPTTWPICGTRSTSSGAPACSTSRRWCACSPIASRPTRRGWRPRSRRSTAARSLRPGDVEAAIAWCDYSLDTVRFVFGDGATGDAGKLLAAIRCRGRQGARRDGAARPVQPQPVRS